MSSSAATNMTVNVKNRAKMFEELATASATATKTNTTTTTTTVIPPPPFDAAGRTYPHRHIPPTTSNVNIVNKTKTMTMKTTIAAAGGDSGGRGFENGNNNPKEELPSQQVVVATGAGATTGNAAAAAAAAGYDKEKQKSLLPPPMATPTTDENDNRNGNSNVVQVQHHQHLQRDQRQPETSTRKERYLKAKQRSTSPAVRVRVQGQGQGQMTNGVPVQKSGSKSSASPKPSSTKTNGHLDRQHHLRTESEEEDEDRIPPPPPPPPQSPSASASAPSIASRRRAEHPAIAARMIGVGVGGGGGGGNGRTSSNTNTFAPSKLSSADLLTSFRRFNATLGSSQAGKNLSDNNHNKKTTNGQSYGLVDTLLPNGNGHGHDDDDQDDDDFENQSLNSAEGSMNPKEQVIVADLEDSIHSMKDDTSFKQNSSYHHHHHQVERVTVSTKESFNDTYLSSLSSTTFSIQSLKSPDGRSAFPTHTSLRQQKKEPPARPRSTNLGVLPEATKENSTSTQTMKSEIVGGTSREPSSNVSTHSAARSIISSSSMNREPPAGRVSLSHDLPTESDGVADPAVLETVVQKTLTHDDATGTNVSSGETKEKVTKEDQKDLAISDDETSLSNRLAGLVFNDTDDEKQKVRIPMEPDAKQSELSTRPSKVLNDSKQGPSAENDGVQKLRHATTQNHGSSSTKETVSISIRSGLSSIQTESLTGIPAQTLEGKIPEGSTSIRSGLSGLQQSPRRMSSQLEHSNSLRGSGRQQDQIGSMHRERGNVPETIAEDQSKLTSPDIIHDNSDEEKSLFSGLKPSSTNDDSSVGNKRLDVLPGRPQLPSSVSVNQKRLGPLVSTGPQAISSNVEINSHPDRQPSNGNEENDEIFPSSTKSRPMGNNSVSKRVENSPKNTAKREHVQQDSASLFSSVDDDVSEDIFGGLEDDNGSRFPSLKKETENQKVDTQTLMAKQRICDDGRNNAAEWPLLETQRVRKYAHGEKKQKKDSRKKSSKPMAKRPQTQTSAKKRRKSLPINSDSSSSLVGDPITSPNVGTETKRKILRRGSDIAGSSPLKDSKLKSPVSRSNSSRKSMPSRRSPASERRASLPSEKREFIDLNKNNHTTKINSVESKVRSDFVNGGVEDEKADNVFASLSCGLTDHCSDVFARMCLSEQKTETEMPINTEDDAEKSSISGNSSAELTALEKKVWTEWDRLNEDVDVQTTTNEAQEEKVDDKKEEQKRKREQAREELLEIASMAMNPNLPENTKKEDDKDSRAPVVSEPIVSASVSTDSKPSTASGGSDTNSFSDSGYSQSSSFSHEEMSHGNISTGNGSDACSEILSKEPLPSTPTNNSRRGVQSPSVASPILLSSGQRNLIEKYSKQLTSVGIEVLKLNTKRKWQIRHLTVSKEMIPLSAHKAISKSEDLTSCHKALLWLKKFNRSHHGDGYGISNIDKNGHGGMLLVDLSEIKVSNVAEDLMENPLPKKLHEPFKNSVLVTMDYKINGSRRSIEFRCKNDDEAQFLCTCTRLVRDLLRREKSLRQKSKSNKLLSNSGQRIPPQNVI